VAPVARSLRRLARIDETNPAVLARRKARVERRRVLRLLGRAARLCRWK
jgi:hypothetical protein